MDAAAPPPPRRRQYRLIAILFAALTGVLLAAYSLFLRTEYGVLFTDSRPEEASAIVAELSRQNIPYRLRDEGATILVPVEQAAAARLALASSDLSARGMVGFELFNESDMGLTDFAQRVNYQRALQGELARTIMQMEGIERARVHLALPERSLFRASRTQPTAAVTVAPRRGRPVDEARVAGIQRLVAAAVPDLALGDVVVLDELGRAISVAPEPVAAMSADLEELTAVQQYYRARARAALKAVLPGLAFEVRVTALPLAAPAAAPADPTGDPSPDGAPARDFRLRIALLTAAALGSSDQALAQAAIGDAVRLDPFVGDSLVFGIAPAAGAQRGAPPPPVPSVAPPRPAPAPGLSLPGGWQIAALLLAALALAVLLRTRGGAMAGDQREAFAQRVRDQLRAIDEGGDVRA